LQPISINGQIKPTFIALIALSLCLGGCGQKEPVQPSASNSTTPSEFEETKASAEAGDADAQYTLGELYRNGQGVEQDFKEALKWYQKAADQGYAAAHMA
jgi:TPR repeat protein